MRDSLLLFQSYSLYIPSHQKLGTCLESHLFPFSSNYLEKREKEKLSLMWNIKSQERAERTERERNCYFTKCFPPFLSYSAYLWGISLVQTFILLKRALQRFIKNIITSTGRPNLLFIVNFLLHNNPKCKLTATKLSRKLNGPGSL